jgi:hypothetical protein
MQDPRTAREHIEADERQLQAAPCIPSPTRQLRRSVSPLNRPGPSQRRRTRSPSLDSNVQHFQNLGGGDNSDEDDAAEEGLAGSAGYGEEEPQIGERRINASIRAGSLDPDAETPFDTHRDPSPLFEELDDLPADILGTILPSTHVYEGPSLALRPTPAVLAQLPNLPAFAHDFKHHNLSPHERMIYTQAAVSSVGGSTHTMVSGHLSFANLLHQQSSGTPVQSPTTDPYEAYTRLGVNPNLVIKRFAVCEDEACCFIWPLHQLHNAPTTHLTPDGLLCKKRIFISGKSGQRKPFRILPFTPPSTLIQCFLRESTFVREVQSWRQGREGDAIGEATLISTSSDPDTPMTSIFDGASWRSRNVNLERIVTTSDIKDQATGSAQRLVGLEFGLVGAINLDWYVDAPRNAPKTDTI